jgi:hypothetical protein
MVKIEKRLVGVLPPSRFKYDKDIQYKQTLELTRLPRVRFATIRNLYADISFSLNILGMVMLYFCFITLDRSKVKGFLLKNQLYLHFFVHFN